MNNKFLSACLLGCAAALALMHGDIAHAAEEDLSRGDPARWYQADDAPADRLRNLNKETAAAYAEALRACKETHGKQARACRKEAMAARKEDAARAKRIYDDYKAAAARSPS